MAYGSINKVTLVGRIGQKPEIRDMQNGCKMATLSIATSEPQRDKLTKKRVEKVEWHRVVIFNQRLIEVAEKYVKKGCAVYLEASLQARKWVDKDGIERHVLEIIVPNFTGVLLVLANATGGQKFVNAKKKNAETTDSEDPSSADDLDADIAS